MAQKIVPNIWNSGSAPEAAEFYTRVVPNSKVLGTTYYPTENLLEFQQSFAGKPLTINLDLGGLEVSLINAGNEFRPNPSISLMVNFDPVLFGGDADAARNALDTMWAELSDGGEVLMELGEYPFSSRYGWVADRWGMTWQLIFTDPDGEPRPFIMPAFLFGGSAQNRAGEAIRHWQELFDGTQMGMSVPYGEQVGPAAPGAVMFADFTLEGQWFVAMDAAAGATEFDPGVSLVVMCVDQAEIDRFWAALSKVPEAEQCGWCTDEFGISWQVVPHNIDDLCSTPQGFAAVNDMKKIELDRF